MTVRDVRVPGSSHEFKIIDVKCRSILNKPVDFEHILLEHEPSVVAVTTETWLSTKIGDEIVPPVYRIFRKDRQGRGGGVAFLIKRYLNCTEISGPTMSKTSRVK